MDKRKFVIELDETPALVFIQEYGKLHPILYQNGTEVKGIRSIEIKAGVDEPTTHKIEYWTGKTGDIEMQSGSIWWSQDSEQKGDSIRIIESKGKWYIPLL
jgi:hypothetical protein